MACCGASSEVISSLCLLQIRGEAEAFAVEAKGRAEAEQMAKKAEAFQQYRDGAMVDMLLEKLPLVRDYILYTPEQPLTPYIQPSDILLHLLCVFV